VYIILLGLGLYSVGGGYTGTSEAVVHFLVYSSSSSSSSIFCQLPPTTRCIYQSRAWLREFLAGAPASCPPPPKFGSASCRVLLCAGCACRAKPRSKEEDVGGTRARIDRGRGRSSCVARTLHEYECGRRDCCWPAQRKRVIEQVESLPGSQCMSACHHAPV
jgi:hypothetical protein